MLCQFVPVIITMISNICNKNLLFQIYIILELTCKMIELKDDRDRKII